MEGDFFKTPPYNTNNENKIYNNLNDLHFRSPEILCSAEIYNLLKILAIILPYFMALRNKNDNDLQVHLRKYINFVLQVCWVIYGENASIIDGVHENRPADTCGFFRKKSNLVNQVLLFGYFTSE